MQNQEFPMLPIYSARLADVISMKTTTWEITVVGVVGHATVVGWGLLWCCDPVFTGHSGEK